MSSTRLTYFQKDGLEERPIPQGLSGPLSQRGMRLRAIGKSTKQLCNRITFSVLVADEMMLVVFENAIICHTTHVVFFTNVADQGAPFVSPFLAKVSWRSIEDLERTYMNYAI